MVREGPSEKMTSERSPKGSEGASDADAQEISACKRREAGASPARSGNSEGTGGLKTECG